MRIIATKEGYPTPAIAFAFAAQMATGFANFTHAYWHSVACNAEGDMMHGLERQLFVVSMLARVPVHALVIHNHTLWRVEPFSEVPNQRRVEPLHIMLHLSGRTWHLLMLDPTTYDTQHSETSMNRRLVLRTKLDLEMAVLGMRGYLRALSVRVEVPPMQVVIPTTNP